MACRSRPGAGVVADIDLLRELKIEIRIRPPDLLLTPESKSKCRFSSVGDVSHISGFIAKFRELGYEVEEPATAVR